MADLERAAGGGRWLTAERFVDACGAEGRAWRRPFVARGGEAELAARVREDPRRLVAIVGEPGAGASRLALELASRGSAWLPDPIAMPDAIARPDPVRDVAALGELLSRSGDEPALVVLDGPDPREALSSLPELLARPLHPRLHVVVPCAPWLARRLVRIAGGYPSGSVMVVAIGGEAAPLEPLPREVDPAGLLLLALAGRLPRELGDDAWIELGIAARAGDGVVALLGERRRRALVEEHLLARGDAPARLAALLERAPRARARVLETLLHVRDGDLDAALVPIACAIDVAELPDPRALFARGVPMSPAVARALVDRGAAEIDRLAGDARGRASLALASLHALLGEREAEAVVLRRALASVERRARLLVELAGTTRDLELATDAVEVARREADAADDGADAEVLALALSQVATLLHANDDREGAIAALEERAAVEERAGRIAARAAALARAATLAGEVDAGRALPLAQAALADRRAIRDVRGQCFLLYRIASLEIDLRRPDEAERAIREALALDEHVEDPQGVGYCRWMLGALADRRGDAAAAAREYDLSVRAYARAGRVPDRLMESLVRARAHAAAPAAIGEEAVAPELPAAPSDPGMPLVRIRPKQRS